MNIEQANMFKEIQFQFHIAINLLVEKTIAQLKIDGEKLVCNCFAFGEDKSWLMFILIFSFALCH